ncbi:fasciclin domain-containing protein [Sphingomonas xanthus]|uniref:Fasciclin domain-containing protein n=1 Tax=Sphingomonas xanthus TaxID=2594473 RepID=A0A516IRQ8_9SPHN|nr:fasciclin domain-containing protein [Sphingomonas xanthus]QDP19606.1 fasciclin domain-containing protein [Sphingomonas xanthus]
MTSTKLMIAVAAAGLLATTGCGEGAAGNNAATATDAAAKAAGDSTIAEGIGDADTFAAAAKQAGLDGTLAGPGPYTVLVPTNAAFDKLPAGTLDALMKDEAKAELTGVLTYHVLPGEILAADIGKAIEAGNGKALLATMAGGTLTATKEGDAIVVSDGAGSKARISGGDERRSNGVIHRIDTVLMPS